MAVNYPRCLAGDAAMWVWPKVRAFWLVASGACGLLLLAACSAPPAGIVGTYTTTITPGDHMSDTLNFGNWILRFEADGTYTAEVGAGRVNGRYRIEGDRLLMEDLGGSYSCARSGADTASAIYVWHRDSDALTLRVERDECKPRRDGLTLRPLKVRP